MISVPSYMTELVNFINEEHGHKYDLLKVALVHHRLDGSIHLAMEMEELFVY